MAEIKTNAIRILDKNKINYTLHIYEPDGNVDAISAAAKINVPVDKVYKTLVTKGKSGAHYVFVIRADGELDLKKAAASVGEKNVEMIAVKDLLKTTGYIRGGCSPVGMKKLFKTVVDAQAEELPAFVVSSGKIGCFMELCPKELQKLIGCEFISVLA